MGLNCMNCKSPVPEGEGKFFANAFVCASCFIAAEHFYKKLEIELKQMMTMAKEGIRLALIQGKFFPQPPGEKKELSKKEVLETALQMESAREAHDRKKSWTTSPSTPTPSSGENIPPHVRTLVATANSSSNKRTVLD